MTRATKILVGATNDPSSRLRSCQPIYSGDCPLMPSPASRESQSLPLSWPNLISNDWAHQYPQVVDATPPSYQNHSIGQAGAFLAP